VAFLREIRPPLATVLVYDHETEAQSLARIAAADVAICGPSTFCIWPSLAANTSYITARAEFSPEKWPAEAKRGVNVVPFYGQTALTPVEITRHASMYNPEKTESWSTCARTQPGHHKANGTRQLAIKQGPLLLKSRHRLTHVFPQPAVS
jgi:hypothetical protein